MAIVEEAKIEQFDQLSHPITWQARELIREGVIAKEAVIDHHIERSKATQAIEKLKAQTRGFFGGNRRRLNHSAYCTHDGILHTMFCDKIRTCN